MAPNSARPLTLRSLFTSKALADQTIRDPRWLEDGRRLAYLDHYPGTRSTTVWVYDARDASRQPLFDPRTIRHTGKPVAIHSANLTADGSRLVLTTSAPARFTPCGDVLIYDIPSRRLSCVAASSDEQYHPELSPDGSELGLVRGNNLVVINTVDGQERTLTHDGSATLYNGRCGWVYEEELGLAKAWAWSPDGSRIAFLQQDESAVPEVLLPRYSAPHADPRVTRYPKAGDPNPTVRPGIIDLADGRIQWISLDGILEPGTERYIAHLQWTPSGDEVLLQILPRLQNRLILAAVRPEDGALRTILEETDEAWVDPPGRLHFAGSSGRFLWPSDRDGRTHLYLYDLSGACLRPITSGPWDVAGIVRVTPAPERVWFTAARPSPADRSLWRAPLESGEPEAVCSGSGVHTPLLSPDGAHVLDTHSTLNRPPKTTLLTGDGRPVDTLIETPSEPFRRCGAPIGDDAGGWELLTFATPDGEELCARMLKPRDFDPTRRYPALMYTYGGPGSQVVLDSWGGRGGLWHRWLADRGCLIFCCDNRGTGSRGRAFKKATYLRLGQREIEDQIAGARYLGALPFVDPRRIGIWGWSYGGYMASLAILLGADVFRAAVAVAPVTDWRLYDTIYTERFMRRPDDNPEGYREGSPVHHAAKLRGRFLLIHGTMDDNVHFQNGARLASALQDAGRQFETMFYPDRHHGIEGRTLHLYTAMTRFLRRSLRF